MDPTKEDIARLLMLQFKRLHKSMFKTLFKTPSGDMKPSPFILMMRVWRASRNGGPGIRVTELANSMGISAPGITQIITALEKSGQVSREMDPEDRRAVLVRMTREGEETMQPVFRQMEERFGQLIDFLGEENSRTLSALLGRVEEFFQEEFF